MKALLVIDVQNDFCKNGSLEVKDANSIVPKINELMDKYEIVVATKDWHPANHSSFLSNNKDGIWPDHCIKGTRGAEFESSLDVEKIDFVFSKGSNVEIDSYSGFIENDQKTPTGLGEFLNLKGVTEVDIVGLALDYCVKFTALDALKYNLKSNIILDATKAVNINKGDDLLAIEELKKAGVKFL